MSHTRSNEIRWPSLLTRQTKFYLFLCRLLDRFFPDKERLERIEDRREFLRYAQFPVFSWVVCLDEDKNPVFSLGEIAIRHVIHVSGGGYGLVCHRAVLQETNRWHELSNNLTMLLYKRLVKLYRGEIRRQLSCLQ